MATVGKLTRAKRAKTTRQIPVGVRAAAEKLKATFPGVVGVFWGHGSTGNQRHMGRDQCLCVHVRWKRPENLVPSGEMIPSVFEGFPTDVIETGASAVHAITQNGELSAISDLPRSGTVTALAPDGEDIVALTSGHVVLPVQDQSIVLSYVAAGKTSVQASLRGNAGEIQVGVVELGKLAEKGDVDFAFVRLAATGSSFVLKHPATGQPPPFRVRWTPLVKQEPLTHFSRLPGRNTFFEGFYDQQAATSIDLLLPDGSDGAYTDVIAVTSSDPSAAFSVDGDSGSLVVDQAGRVVGMVLGGSVDGSTGYVLPISALLGVLGSENVGRDNNPLFFE